MNRRFRRRDAHNATGGRSYLTTALSLAAATTFLLAAYPADAQMRGGYGGGFSGGGGRGGGSFPGPWTGRPSRADGPGWGRRPRYPGPIGGFPIWVDPRPRYVEEVVVVRERPASAPPARATGPKAQTSPARQAPTPVRTRPDRPRRVQFAAAGENHVPGEVVVEFQPGTTPAMADQVARQYGLARVSAQPISLLDTTLHRFRIGKNRRVETVVGTLTGDFRVASVQPNFIFRLQGAASGEMARFQYASAKLRLPEAQEIATGEGVTVAIIDSGIDTEHPEVAAAISRSIAVSGAAPKPDPHGTAIAGIVAARAKLVGAAPAAQLIGIQAFAPDASAKTPRGTSTDIVQAISLAAEAGVRLANLSFAGPSDPMLARALAASHGRGTIFVAAAGNAGPKAPPSYPAADPHVIAVTATDGKDALFGAANRGPYVAVAAPGVDVLVAAPGKGYKLSSGTSMAAAHVTGVLALALQKRPGLTLEEARQVLTGSTKDLGAAGPDPEFGAGLVDARLAVERAAEGSSPQAQIVATVPVTQ